MPKLSDRTELGGASQANDTIHVVRGGVSYKRIFSNFFNTARIPFRVANGNREFFISRKDPDGNVSNVLAAGDILLYIDTDAERLVLGIALGAVSSYPTDLEDDTKFMRFLDQSALL